jgi:hypothetical protein
MLSFLFMRLFGCLCFAVGHCVKCPFIGDDLSIVYRYTNMC